MNTYLLEYYNHTGIFKREYVEWNCDGDRYILDHTCRADSMDYYIVAFKLKNYD